VSIHGVGAVWLTRQAGERGDPFAIRLRASLRPPLQESLGILDPFCAEQRSQHWKFNHDIHFYPQFFHNQRA
jgi:hypothetical protein